MPTSAKNKPFPDKLRDALKDPTIAQIIRNIVSSLFDDDTCDCDWDQFEDIKNKVNRLEAENAALKDQVNELIKENKEINGKIQQHMGQKSGESIEYENPGPQSYAHQVSRPSRPGTNDGCRPSGSGIQGGSKSSGPGIHGGGRVTPTRPRETRGREGEWREVTRKSIRGSKAASATTKIKAVERQVCIFVGRLHRDTTVEELQEYLTDATVTHAKIKKLEDKNGRVFNTAAFQVYAPAQFEDILYDSGTWPEECLVREWFFKPAPVAPPRIRRSPRASASACDAPSDAVVTHSATVNTEATGGMA